MQSVLINTNLLIACKEEKIQRYFFSSRACAYNTTKQKDVFIEGLKEKDAYPANPEDGYGWEKLFSERMCRHFQEDYGLEVRVARYHNIYGPFGTYDGGREKAPAALSRKVAQSKIDKNYNIEVWGDGEQTRTFLYVDDCVEGTLKLFESDYSGVVNIGSDEQVSINQMIDIIEEISGVDTLKREYQLLTFKNLKIVLAGNQNLMI
jgi:nucleoside-diphosphate-sugar epimerase